MKKVLVTGSCGFIFGNFIRKAIYDQNQKKPQDRQYTFASIDRVSVNALNSFYWNKNHVFHPADIRDAHVMDIIFQFEKPDIVIHGASVSDSSDSTMLTTSNVVGTQVIIDACLKHNVERLIYISTDAVYGDLQNENAEAWTEESPISPNSVYSASKASSELLVKAANKSHGLIYNIVRSSNCYGPRQGVDKLIPASIQASLSGNPITIYGQGKDARDWTYVADYCAGLITILDKGESNEIYNLSSNHEFTTLETINMVSKHLDSPTISFAEDPVKNRDARRLMNTSKVQKLGWKPTYKFKDGIQDTVQWYLDNRWFMK